jgi:acetoin utilization deacetylase AcuC-like enzyme/GNAT superfamily N-acetyltransferase
MKQILSIHLLIPFWKVEHMPEQLPNQPRARLIFDPAELKYDFGPHHPLQARRLISLIDLLETSGLWRSAHEQTRLPLRAATIEELSLNHTADYIEAVQRLSVVDREVLAPDEERELEKLELHYGFAEGDTPALPDMHNVSALIAGGSLVALSAVMGLPEGGTFSSEEDRPLHVYHPAGGLHHAWADRASGFCVYNDISVAIAHILQTTEAKVLYIDFDAHHGDGVQKSFYDDPRVMKISFHETGRYLFPGTGDVLELGSGIGRGYTVNVPLEPFTEDDSYNEAMNALLPPLITFFAPDVIVSVHGCDTHAWDPLTHLKLTMRSIQKQMEMAHQLAHTYCQGRWVALGGGGYDLYRVVPRAWSMLWAEMSDQALPKELPAEWVTRWRPEWLAVRDQEESAQEVMGKATAADDFPTTYMDRQEDFPAQPRRRQINEANRRTVALVRHLLVPSPVRHAFPTVQYRSPLTGLFDLLHLRGTATPSRSKVIETRTGEVLLRDFCPPSFVERLRPDDGLRAFARLPDREYQLLLGISKSPDCALTLAYTPSGEIIGEVTLAPADAFWDGIENVYEVAIEVSSNWRGMGVARQLLAFALELDALEDMILFAIGLSWHWDTQGLGITVHRYRQIIVNLFASQGFVEYPTTEPNVSMEPGNVLLARIGSRVDQRVASQFHSRLLSTPNLARL